MKEITYHKIIGVAKYEVLKGMGMDRQSSKVYDVLQNVETGKFILRQKRQRRVI
jgi:hypothetical protein